MITTSVTLLARLKDGKEQAAWLRFVELYTPLLLTWARRIGLQDSDAADLVQEVFSMLLYKLPEFVYDRDKSFRGWLRTVALNQWRAGLRRRCAIREGEPLHGLELPAREAEAFWEVEYRAHLVKRALQVMQQEFQPKTWQACWECIVNGRSTAEVGAEFELSQGAVRAAKFRILARLRQELDGLLD